MEAAQPGPLRRPCVHRPLTVTDNRVCQPEPQMLAKVMDRLIESARLSLRRGDMIARYSPAQLVIMLPTVTYEMGQMVCERLTRNFKRENPTLNVAISYNLRPMEPPRASDKEGISDVTDERDGESGTGTPCLCMGRKVIESLFLQIFEKRYEL